ncbi:MAG: hypothetical protein ABR600_14415, partial [Actinomycetota bacterium]
RRIQAAVDAAHPGDWILIGPGDYRERGSLDPEDPAGVLIETDGLHVRGMNRNTVIVDGTKPGARKPCDPAYHSQFYGPKDADGHWAGMNGVYVDEATGVTVDNLTACNFLATKHGEGGNEIWFNGGDGTGTIGMHEYAGSYLTATSTYSHGVDKPRGEYGIFVSNADGPGLIVHTYASNMGDAAYYVGACPNCNVVLRDAHAQHSALAYSGTNSGGNLIIEDSEFDHNKTGPTSNSQNNDDRPSPEDGACPNGGTGPTGTTSCTIWRNNYSHDNNDPNVPGSGSGLSGSAPVGTGFVLAGTRNVTLWHNRIEHNGAWGVLVADLPDQETPPPGANCQGGTQLPEDTCLYQAWGNETANNTFKDNGFFGNDTNGDIGLATNEHDPGNCFHGNTDPDGLTSDPPNIQDPPYDSCANANAGDYGPLAAQALCATQLLAPCPSNAAAAYPRPTKVKLHMPPPQPTMPNPCTGVPANPWCAGGHPASRSDAQSGSSAWRRTLMT